MNEYVVISIVPRNMIGTDYFVQIVYIYTGMLDFQHIHGGTFLFPSFSWQAEWWYITGGLKVALEEMPEL